VGIGGGTLVDAIVGAGGCVPYGGGTGEGFRETGRAVRPSELLPHVRVFGTGGFGARRSDT
jgi:hypothetical protein